MLISHVNTEVNGKTAILCDSGSYGASVLSLLCIINDALLK